MFDGDNKCDSPIFTENELKDIVVKAVNQLYKIKADVLETFTAIKADLDNTEAENARLEELATNLEELLKEQTDHLNKLKTSKQDITVWHEKNDEIEERIAKVKNEIDTEQQAIQEKETCKLEICEFVENLNKIDGEITEWTDDLLFGLVEYIEAGKDKTAVMFKNGARVEV